MSAAPRMLPVVILSLAALGVLKTASLFIGFSAAGASETPSSPTLVAAPPVETEPSEVEKRILEQLSARRAELDLRAEALDTREALLAGAERRVEERIAALQAERAALANVNAELRQRKTDEFAALSSAYAKMKPRDAARIFDILEDDILVPVASGMRTQSLSGVLAEMNPERARRLTRLLADQPARPETIAQPGAAQ